jgi:hypothetical protein
MVVVTTIQLSKALFSRQLPVGSGCVGLWMFARDGDSGVGLVWFGWFDVRVWLVYMPCNGVLVCCR